MAEKTSKLAELAARVPSQPVASFPWESVRSQLQHVIKSRRGARLKSETPRDTDFVTCNLHLVSKYEKDLWQCQSESWPDDDDDADPLHESNGNELDDGS